MYSKFNSERFPNNIDLRDAVKTRARFVSVSAIKHWVTVALGFVDLEKAFDTMPRELTFAVMRWMEVGEAEVRMVEEMYKETTAVVRAERETSEQFGVGELLRQGSALSPLLFIMVMNLISGKVSEQNLRYYMQMT